MEGAIGEDDEVEPTSLLDDGWYALDGSLNVDADDASRRIAEVCFAQDGRRGEVRLQDVTHGPFAGRALWLELGSAGQSEDVGLDERVGNVGKRRESARNT